MSTACGTQPRICPGCGVAAHVRDVDCPDDRNIFARDDMKLGATILHLTKLKRKNDEWDIPAYSRLPLWLRYWFDADLRDAQRFDYHYVCTLCLQSWDVAPGQPWPAVEDPAQAAKIR